MGKENTTAVVKVKPVYALIGTIGEIDVNLTFNSQKIALDVRNQFRAAGYDTKLCLMKTID